ncbi:hypothetical protein GCM10010357_49970 [Streptomyces luteireticuli]|uniref:Uncharacterized protein n=1 Tax=Streptomyces luteireticuli TaxID=173858 RepID=A0ABN0YZ23_9ACTN
MCPADGCAGERGRGGRKGGEGEAEGKRRVNPQVLLRLSIVPWCNHLNTSSFPVRAVRAIGRCLGGVMESMTRKERKTVVVLALIVIAIVCYMIGNIQP